MKKLILATIAIGALGLSSATALQVTMTSAFNSSANGNYQATPSDGLESVLSNYTLGKSTDGTTFGTFCLEKNENFNPGGLYDVVLNDGAVNGGAGGAITDGRDILSIGTAHLYQQFVLGTLSGFTYGSSTSAAQLQNTFWYLEGEITSTANTGTFLTTAMAVTDWDQDYTGTAVKVMNLTQGGVHKQDQLVYVPDGGVTVGLLGLAFVGLAAFRRRFIG